MTKIYKNYLPESFVNIDKSSLTIETNKLKYWINNRESIKHNQIYFKLFIENSLFINNFQSNWIKFLQ